MIQALDRYLKICDGATDRIVIGPMLHFVGALMGLWLFVAWGWEWMAALYAMLAVLMAIATVWEVFLVAVGVYRFGQFRQSHQSLE